MYLPRYISVLFSLSAILITILVGVLGCETKVPPFDESAALYGDVSGEKALEHVTNLVGFGPRPAGSDALEKSRIYIIRELEKCGWTVQRQTFEELTPEGNVKFVNLLARYGDDPWERRISGLICSHYETKMFGFEFVGANDAGSSTGLLLELARVLAQKPALAKKLELVFFDGEEAFGPRITETDGLYGSKYYAAQIARSSSRKRPHWGVLLDMVGDKDLNIRAATQIPNASIRELKKAEDAGQAVDIERVRGELATIAKQLLMAATDLDVRSRIGISSEFITDDHIPLNTVAGIPTIDLIDFDYGNYWHTPADTLDKISAESLDTVGKVTLLLIEKYLRK